MSNTTTPRPAPTVMASEAQQCVTSVVFASEARQSISPSSRTALIVRAACRIAAGSAERLRLGNLDIQRDWGWAPEYVDAMWRMLQQTAPQDLIIATGETRPLQDFVAEAFNAANLDWRDHTETDASLMRPTDIRFGRANPALAAAQLGWVAQKHMHDVVRAMVAAEQSRRPEN